MSAVFDTGIVVDYLRGYKPSTAAFKRFPHRAITVATWVEVMSEARKATALANELIYITRYARGMGR